MDFSANPLTLITGTGTTRMMQVSGGEGELIRVSAGVDLTIADVLSVRGSAAFDKHSTSVKLASGETVYVDQLGMGLSNVWGFFGVGGPYRVDSNADGVIDSKDTPNANAFGLSISDMNLAMGVFTPIKTVSLDAKYAATRAFAGTTWLGLSAGVAAVDLVGLPDVKLSASDLSLELNRAGNLPFGKSADASVIDFKKTPVAIRTGVSTSRTLALDGSLGESTRAAGAAQIQIGSILNLDGSLSFEVGTRSLGLTSGGTIATRALIIGGSDLSARVATGMEASALGFDLSGLDFGLILARSTLAGDTRSWLAAPARPMQPTCWGPRPSASR
jgi:hypothetical protein